MKNVIIFNSNNRNWLLLDTIDRYFYYEFMRKNSDNQKFVSSLNLITQEQAEEVCCLESNKPKLYRLVLNNEVLTSENPKAIVKGMLNNFDMLRDFVNPILFEIYDFDKTVDIIRSFKYNNYD